MQGKWISGIFHESEHLSSWKRPAAECLLLLLICTQFQKVLGLTLQGKAWWAWLHCAPVWGPSEYSRAAVLSRCLQAISKFAPHFVLIYLPRPCNLLFKLTVFLFTLVKNLAAPFPCGNEPGKLSHGRSAQRWAVPSSPACPMFHLVGQRTSSDLDSAGSSEIMRWHSLTCALGFISWSITFCGLSWVGLVWCFVYTSIKTPGISTDEQMGTSAMLSGPH